MNSADPKEIKRRNRKERRAKDRFDADLRSVCGTAEGRRFVWWLLSEAGIHRTSFRTSALEMSMLEGQRNLGLKLENAVLEACPDLYLLAQDEAQKATKRETETELALEATPEKEDDHG